MCDDESKLPRALGERVLFGFVSLSIMIIFGFGTLILVLTPMPPLGFLFDLALIATQELCLATTVIGALGFVWALATPSWLERLYRSVMQYLFRAIVFGFIIMWIVGIWLKNGAGFAP